MKLAPEPAEAELLVLDSRRWRSWQSEGTGVRDSAMARRLYITPGWLVVGSSLL